MLPTTCFAEEDGSLTNSARWVQWHWKAADAPGEARSDIAIMSGLFRRMQVHVSQGWRGVPRSDPEFVLELPRQRQPTPEELAKEINGRALTDVKDAAGATVLRGGQLLDGFAQLRDDGSTACGCWIYSGVWTERGNMMGRRDASDPREQGLAPNWAFAWPANRRILYNRAGADQRRQAVEPEEAGHRVVRDAMGGHRRARLRSRRPIRKPASGRSSCRPRGWRGCSRAIRCAKDHFPSIMSRWKARCLTCCIRRFRPIRWPGCSTSTAQQFGKVGDFPYVGTTYRLTEHFHFWTKHARINAILQPEEFAEVGEVLAKEKGIAQGDWIKLSSNRGEVICKAYVTKRLKPMMVDGKPCHVIGLPIHWGFTGAARKGFGANTLTPFVGDANTETPEFKAFLVNIEKAPVPVA